MKKVFIFLFLATLFSCSENKVIKNDYNPEIWDCIIDDTLMYSKRKNGYEIGGAQKGCTCAEIELFELKVFGKLSQKFEKDFGCKKSKISEIYKNIENNHNDKVEELKDELKEEIKEITYENQKKSEIIENNRNNNGKLLKTYDGYMTENVKLRKEAGIKGEVIRVIQKEENIKVTPEARTFKDGFEWTLVSDYSGNTGWAIIDYIKVFY